MIRFAVKPTAASADARHDRITILLHWLTAFLVLAQFGSAHIWELLEKGTPWRTSLIMTHLASGVVLATTVFVRILWKLARRDRLAPAVSGLQHVAATTVHMFLYGLLAAQVVLGFLFSWSFGQPLPFFNLFTIPVPIAIDPSFRTTLAELHNAVAWAIIALVGVHATAALTHHYVLRDGILLRMLPGRTS
jgi:cytochrome b561